MAEKSDTERRILKDACLEFGIEPGLVDELIDLELEQEGRLRRIGLVRNLKAAIEFHVLEQEDDSPQN